MPSSAQAAKATLADRALEALAERVDASRIAVDAAREEVTRHATHAEVGEGMGVERALVELGPFALGRIDAERFAKLASNGEALGRDSVGVLARAAAILAGFAHGRETHLVPVEPGGDLRDAVKDALARFGWVFGAARAVELARSGGYDEEKHGHLLGPLPFRSWNRAERQLAPPLVVEVRGEDCLPAGLGEFLDGGACIVLVATGPTTPAPLARLITPGTYVLQTADPDDLAPLARSPHPAVALLFDEVREEQARFVHDPDAGVATWARLRVDHLPEPPQVGRGRRAPVWLEELSHLKALAERPPEASAPAPEPDLVAAEVPADRLAAFLLSQTELGG